MTACESSLTSGFCTRFLPSLALLSPSPTRRFSTASPATATSALTPLAWARTPHPSPTTRFVSLSFVAHHLLVLPLVHAEDKMKMHPIGSRCTRIDQAAPCDDGHCSSSTLLLSIPLSAFSPCQPSLSCSPPHHACVRPQWSFDARAARALVCCNSTLLGLFSAFSLSDRCRWRDRRRRSRTAAWP